MTFVTVLMPAHNAGQYIAEAIASVLNQGYAFFELLIVNDGSSDDTADVIRSFSDSRIRVLNQENQGISAALNAGLRAARGEYIARFDADDICHPQRLEEQVGFLNAHPDYILVGSDAEYIQADGEHLFDFRSASYTDEQIRKKLYHFCPFIHSSVMYRREEVLHVGGYSLHAHHFEDYLLWVNLIRAGKCCNLQQALIRVRFNPGSLTIDEKWRGEAFRRFKMRVIRRGCITETEGRALDAMLKKQDSDKFKESAYHALCCKKFLADNHQPGKARKHALRAIAARPLRADNYLMFLLSYLPQGWIRWLRGQQKKNAIAGQ